MAASAPACSFIRWDPPGHIREATAQRAAPLPLTSIGNIQILLKVSSPDYITFHGLNLGILPLPLTNYSESFNKPSWLNDNVHFAYVNCPNHLGPHIWVHKKNICCS
jgi:hypothetical protein